jgi:hypothetical protein
VLGYVNDDYRCDVTNVKFYSQEAGIDVRLGELAGYIQETMESYEVEVGGKVYPGQYLLPVY